MLDHLLSYAARFGIMGILFYLFWSLIWSVEAIAIATVIFWGLALSLCLLFVIGQIVWIMGFVFLQIIRLGFVLCEN